jgi:nucleotide-binding universal stress UspA family protein
MEKVLLAIDGMSPDRKVFSHAVQLCKRIKAELNVLQVIRPGNYSAYLKKVRGKTNQARRYIEGSLLAATFAEAGEHETAKEMMAEALKNISQLLPESEKAGIPCSLTMKAGNPSKEIINYVKEHRDVVLTIYDTPGEEGDKPGVTRKKKTAPRKITRALSIPVVIINS